MGMPVDHFITASEKNQLKLFINLLLQALEMFTNFSPLNSDIFFYFIIIINSYNVALQHFVTLKFTS